MGGAKAERVFGGNCLENSMREISNHKLQEISGGVNVPLMAQGGLLLLVSGVAIGVGAISGPVGVGLVTVGTIGAGLGTTALASGWGDASGVGSATGHVTVGPLVVQSSSSGGEAVSGLDLHPGNADKMGAADALRY